jgi:FAD:protein FMN transferase
VKTVFLAVVFLAACITGSPVHGDSDPVVALSGSTMGTTYSIKVFDSPVLADDLAMAVDAELRRVNSEMSTYLKTSEISRFAVNGLVPGFAPTCHGRSSSDPS